MSSGMRPSLTHRCPHCGYGWDGDWTLHVHVCPSCKKEWRGDAKAHGEQLGLLPRSEDGAETDVEAVLTASPTTPLPTAYGDTDPGKSDERSPEKSEAAAEHFQESLEVPAVSKPSYRIPTMDELRASPRNGYTVISTFSGCGGSSLGFRWAGFRSLWASEFVPAAADTYHANFPDTPLGVDDIRNVEPEMLLARFGLRRGELDVLEGSPPCASFSMAGKRDSHWGEVKKYSDVTQRTDDLLLQFARLLDGLQPRAFVMENVPGLLGGVAKGYWDTISKTFQAAGYRIGEQIVDAQWLGVPQRRKRAIIIGFRRDLDAGRWPEWYPERLPYRFSIKDALPHLAGATLEQPGHGYFDGSSTSMDESMVTVRPGSGSGAAQPWQMGIVNESYRLRVDQRTSSFSNGDYAEQSLDEPIATVTRAGIGADVDGDWQLIAPTPEELAETDFTGYALESEWAKLAAGETSDKYLNLVRPDSDDPSPTVTQTGGTNPGTASVTHPTEPRKFTLRELRRLCGFPDDFVLTGSFRQGWERLGRAVPPPMSYAIAKRMADVLREIDERTS